MKSFRNALQEAYLENPCQVLAHPLWRTLDKINDFQTVFGSDTLGVNRLEAWNDESLYIYWRRQGRQSSHLISSRLNTLQLALIHQDFLDPDTVAGFTTRKSYFRLLHNHQALPSPALPAGLQFAPAVDMQAVISFVENHEQVEEWRSHPTFNGGLWTWIKDGDTPVGLGIAELDTTVGEASLEWVQVQPDYRGAGLGKNIIYELLRRIRAQTAFTTVTGEVENRDNPGAFFRHCGFTGQDVWWLLARA